MTPPAFVIWGARGHGIVLHELVTLCGGSVAAFVDRDRSLSSPVPGVPLLGDIAEVEELVAGHPDRFTLAVAIGGARGGERMEIHRELTALGLKSSQMIHPAAIVAPSAELGAGTQALAGAIVASRAVLGVQCIVNHGAQVDHECLIGHGTHLAPGSVLAGEVRLGESVFVGAGAVVLPRVTVGDGAVIGAAALVRQDVPAGAVVVGVPARPIDARQSTPTHEGRSR